MSASHTPGPWSVFDGREVDGISPWVVTGSGDPSDSDGLYVAGLAVIDAETLANARLIAAAPDLLEALKTVRDYVSDIVEGHIEGSAKLQFVAREDIVTIDAAIAKALGQ